VQTDDDEDLIEEAERDWSGDEMKKKRRRGRKRRNGAKGRKKGAKGKGTEVSILGGGGGGGGGRASD
jgi:hypothetical protein